MKPLLSVILPVYNCEKYLAVCIESILVQTFKDFELIIIDDGSTDQSYNIIKSFRDSRIIVSRQNNKGLACTLNYGLKISKADIVARIDADDICFPERFEKQYEFLMNNEEYIIVGSQAVIIDKEGNRVYTTNSHEVPCLNQEIKNKFPLNPFIHSSVMFRKKYVIECGGYYEPIKHYFEDLILWNKLKKYGKMYNLSSPLIYYRLTPTALTTKHNSKEMREVQKSIIDRILNNEDIDELKERFIELNSKVTIKEKEKSYYLLLAKKYLYNNINIKLARKNIFQLLKISKFSNYYAYILFALSMLPINILEKLIKIKKNY